MLSNVINAKDEQEFIEKAKKYIDHLANGININGVLYKQTKFIIVHENKITLTMKKQNVISACGYYIYYDEYEYECDYMSYRKFMKMRTENLNNFYLMKFIFYQNGFIHEQNKDLFDIFPMIDFIPKKKLMDQVVVEVKISNYIPYTEYMEIIEKYKYIPKNYCGICRKYYCGWMYYKRFDTICSKCAYDRSYHYYYRGRIEKYRCVRFNKYNILTEEQFKYTNTSDKPIILIIK